MKGELFFLFLSKITLACCKKSEERQCVKTFNLIRLELNKTHQELSKEQRIIPNCICNSSKILPGALRAPADSRPPSCGCTICKAGGGTTLISCCYWGEEAGHRDARGNSTGPGSRSSVLSVQCLYSPLPFQRAGCPRDPQQPLPLQCCYAPQFPASSSVGMTFRKREDNCL